MSYFTVTSFTLTVLLVYMSFFPIAIWGIRLGYFMRWYPLLFETQFIMEMNYMTVNLGTD